MSEDSEKFQGYNCSASMDWCPICEKNFFVETLQENNGFCPDCCPKDRPKKEGPITRSQTWKTRKKNLCEKLQDSLNRVEYAHGSDMKVEKIIEFLDLVVKHWKFMQHKKFDNFRHTVWNKLVEFLLDDLLFPDQVVLKYIRKLFPGREIPK